MKIVKKRGLKQIRIMHNKKLFWIIIILIIILVISIIFVVIGQRSSNSGNNQNNNSQKECLQDSDCVPVCGCHPSSCIPKDKKPECDRVFCTEVCTGPLDCGAGICGCISGKCRIISG